MFDGSPRFCCKSIVLEYLPSPRDVQEGYNLHKKIKLYFNESDTPKKPDLVKNVLLEVKFVKLYFSLRHILI